jgi:hypothetical protein
MFVKFFRPSPILKKISNIFTFYRHKNLNSSDHLQIFTDTKIISVCKILQTIYKFLQTQKSFLFINSSDHLQIFTGTKIISVYKFFRPSPISKKYQIFLLFIDTKIIYVCKILQIIYKFLQTQKSFMFVKFFRPSTNFYRHKNHLCL